jgi:flavin-dependent dehydrogenase
VAKKQDNAGGVGGSAGLELADGSLVAVVGGGPAAAFFAIRLLRGARARGRRIEVLIFERKRELHFCQPADDFAACGGCNFCAGGISPRLVDILREDGLSIPDEVVEARVREVTIHGDWKSFELPVPDGREMLSVFRGSRPKRRPHRYLNFDSFLLERAQAEGARVLTAEVTGVRYGDDGRPILSYRPEAPVPHAGRPVPPQATPAQAVPPEETLEADLAVFATGVNRTPAARAGDDSLMRALGDMLPGFVPPRVRRSIISEMQVEEAVARQMEGEAHFAQYGAADLHIEMSSLLPKGRIMTVVLLGRTVDGAAPREDLEIVKRFLAQPHIRRLIPAHAHLAPVCLCHPNMSVGAAKNGFGDRVALIGDMAVARLYKDGIFSAHLTGSALAECALDQGVDRESLGRGYWNAVREIDRDNAYGRAVFFLNRLIFSHPLLSRMFYQALITERKTRPKAKRRLAEVMWMTASGDDSYRSILRGMVRPAALWGIVMGGVLTTGRNYTAERVYGLRWTGFGRYPTGVAEEDVEEKRREIFSVLGIPAPARPPHFERMYSIRIKADEGAVFHQLGKFGDADREYFTPRLVKVSRTFGEPNQVGSTVRYQVTPAALSFSAVLEKVVDKRYLLYRVRDGFARGGILAFDIAPKKPGGGFLTIYVAFDFPAGGRPLGRLGWRLFRLLFPSFLHDVIWNHSLCKLKQVAEADETAPRDPGSGPETDESAVSVCGVARDGEELLYRR